MQHDDENRKRYPYRVKNNYMSGQMFRNWAALRLNKLKRVELDVEEIDELLERLDS